jgi:DnaK suppressor protein
VDTDPEIAPRDAARDGDEGSGRPTQLSHAERTELGTLVQQQLEDTCQRIVDLEAELRSIVESSEGANIDDEHDPEGATIAYERALVISLLDTARSTATRLEVARGSLDDDTFGRCVSCGGPIEVERLFARPSTTTCVDCA